MGYLRKGMVINALREDMQDTKMCLELICMDLSCLKILILQII